MNHDRHVFLFRSLLEETKLIKIFKGIVFDEQKVADLWDDKINPQSWRNEKKRNILQLSICQFKW